MAYHDMIDITYRFRLSDSKEYIYPLHLHPETLALIAPERAEVSEWEKLEFKQCPNCPLVSSLNPLCPVASNIGMLAKESDAFPSYSDVYLEVTSQERTVSAETTLQRGLSSLLGLILATSACPHTRYFRPMARFHLPLACEEETIYRAASMYLLAQYFINKEGGIADIELIGLSDIYYNMQIVNRSLAQRLRAADDGDATVNAVVLLDLFAKALPVSITDSLSDMRYLFSGYLTACN